MSQLNEIRRARPLLGTIVEISASGVSEDQICKAIDCAFKTMQQVHSLMSFHEDSSDVSRLNREAYSHPTTVHPWTYEVIKQACQFSDQSKGVFSISVGHELQLWGFLPNKFPQIHNKETFIKSELPLSNVIGLSGDTLVQFSIPMIIDVGGIAKGFAVDKAIETLQSFNLTAGKVNAGGDMRVFGNMPERVHLRSPSGNAYMSFLEIQNEALATSSPELSKKKLTDREVSPLLNGFTRQPITRDISVSIRAATCVVADALTKIVIGADDDWSTLLQEYNATAYKIDQGQVFVLQKEHLQSDPVLD